MTARTKKGTKFWLSFALILCLISSIGASIIQSSFGAVRVDDFKIVTGANTYINGQIYIPKNASADNKLPLIVVSHGSYNNLDHQDLNMIELSRRGYVVISSDAYNHGSSSTNVADVSVFPTQNMHQLIDYAVSAYDFIDTDNIGVAGHSMGGIIASTTVKYFFQQAALGLSNTKIKAVLDIGYDPQTKPYEFDGVSNPVNPAINWGVICAKYDEWFFKGDTGNPAKYLESTNAKDFVNSLDGVNVTDAVENGKIYTGTIDGNKYIRVIYQNNEIHPLNHFSMAAASHAIDFFYQTLGTPSSYSQIPSSNQIWMYKEAFNCIGLVGIFIFLFSFASVVMDEVPYFGQLKAGDTLAIAPKPNTKQSKQCYWLTYIINLVIPALLVMPIEYYLVGKKVAVPFTFNSWFGEPNTNELAAWTAVVAVCLLAVFLISHKLSGEKGIPDYWGLKTDWKTICKSFLLALLTVGSAYVILFFSDLVFNTDFRIWVIDMRVFTVDKIVYALAYFPAFAAFYLVNSMLVDGGNRVEGMPDWKVTLLSCIGNIAGIVTLIIIQYSGIIGSGKFTFNSMRIVNLFPLVFLIPIATIISRHFFKKTGKIYAGGFTMAMLYTMMTVSNTMFIASILK